MRRLLQPKILIPTIVSIGIVAGLLSIAGPATVAGTIWHFPPLGFLWFFLLLLAYELVRGTQWCYLLANQRVPVPLRGQIFAFLLGEVTKSLPLGNFFQNYLLQQQAPARQREHQYIFSLTAAATVLVTLLEIAVGLTALVLFGLGEWTAIVRLVILIGLPVSIFIGWLLYRFVRSRPQRGSPAASWRRTLLRSLRTFWHGAKDVLHARTIAVSLLLTATYTVLAAGMLEVVLIGSGQPGVGIVPALAAYSFGMVFNLIFPFPTDVGVTEAGGAAALAVVGVPFRDAVNAMVVFRVFNVVLSLLIVALSLPFLRHEAATALHIRPVHKSH